MMYQYFAIPNRPYSAGTLVSKGVWLTYSAKCRDSLEKTHQRTVGRCFLLHV